MALVSNNSVEDLGAKPAETELGGIIEQSKAALKADEKVVNVGKKRGRRSNAEKAAAEAAASAPPPPVPFEPKPAGLAPILFSGVKIGASGYSKSQGVPEVQMPDADASAVADSLDMAIGTAFPDVANSKWGVVFACVISAAAVCLKFGNDVSVAVMEKKKNEFKATNSNQDPVFSVPVVTPQTPGIQTHL